MADSKTLDLAARFRGVRARSVALAAPLSVEDQLVQPMPDASPTKWHLAHTTWFFEAVVLGREGAATFDPSFAFLFNSYYESLGPRVDRANRGLLSRPSLDRVRAYRQDVDAKVERAIEAGALDDDAVMRLVLGLHHEQQHQELLLTDIKYALGTQPGGPAYRADLDASSAPRIESAWRAFEGGIAEIGASDEGFSFDNERPRHRALVEPFRLATAPVDNAAVASFIEAGGYRDPRLWLSDGWATVKSAGWELPLYWQRGDGAFVTYTLGGMRPVVLEEPACHLSLYEADAIARFLGARLPTEVEWERASAGVAVDDANDADVGRLHPSASGRMFGDVWEWTSSGYSPYPRFKPLEGALAEYNGKFMSGQVVLRGGSCFTPRGHVRASYRNFFPPGARWQMTGARLASDG